MKAACVFKPAIACSVPAHAGPARDSNPNISNLYETPEESGVRHLYFESPGTALEWVTWRRDLYQSAPQLFQN
jgi:hypothetical protein